MAFPDEAASFWTGPATYLWHRHWRRAAPDPYFVPDIASYEQTVRQRLLLHQRSRAKSPALLSGIPPCPLSYALAPNGYVYFANGLIPVFKWDGVRFEASVAGVPAPGEALTLAGSGTGTISGTYTAYQRWLDADGNPGNLSPVSASITVDDASTITYTNVVGPAPEEQRVTRRQILRNTNGQAVTYYVDVDTEDLSATTFTSTNTDTTLSTQSAFALFDEDGRSSIARYGEPPDNKAVLACYLSRLFAAGEASYDAGHIELTNGSATVQGVGTFWDGSLSSRHLYVVNHPFSYFVSSVDPVTQVLTLSEVYKGETDHLGQYALRSAPGERNLIYFTEAGLYDAWPPTNTIAIDQNEDEITGLASADSFLFILMRRHVYRLTYNINPGIDGGIFLSVLRGCVNQRCWLYVDENLYLLDEQGVYRFAGSQAAEPVSDPVQDLFWLDRGDEDPDALRVNWSAQKFFHAAHSRSEKVLRWFVALGGDYLPKHALCYHYGRQTWWVESYPWPVGASAVWEGSAGRYLAAGPARRVLAPTTETLDGPKVGSGTTRGTVSSSTPDSLTDAYAAFPASRLVGNPVALVDGRGKGQVRMVTAVSDTTVRVDQPWAVLPDTTTVYQLGGVPWRWKSGWFRWAEEELTNPRKVSLWFEPCATDNTLDLRLYEEHAHAPTDWSFDYPYSRADSNPVTCRKNEPDAVIDLTGDSGFAQLRLDGGGERNVPASDTLAVELRGVSAETPTRVYEIDVEGAE